MWRFIRITLDTKMLPSHLSPYRVYLSIYLSKELRMAQLSLYMDDAAMELLRADAAIEQKSISAYAREVLESRKADKRGWVNGWPPGYFESVFGSSPDFPEVSDLPADSIEAW